MITIGRAIFAALALLVIGCSRVSVDDAKNWELAFTAGRLPDVNIIHSIDRRPVPNITNEFHYFFHVRHNDALLKKLVADKRLSPKRNSNRNA